MDTGQEGSHLTMPRRRIGWIAAALFGALILYAWIDGGEEPLRPIEQPVLLPAGLR